MLSILSLSSSILKIFPKITRSVVFKKYTVFQFVFSFGVFGYYCLSLNNLKEKIPQEEFEIRKRGEDRVVY